LQQLLAELGVLGDQPLGAPFPRSRWIRTACEINRGNDRRNFSSRSKSLLGPMRDPIDSVPTGGVEEDGTTRS